MRQNGWARLGKGNWHFFERVEEYSFKASCGYGHYKPEHELKDTFNGTPCKKCLERYEKKENKH